jgi:uncharacterized protein (TIGR03437 family)
VRVNAYAPAIFWLLGGPAYTRIAVATAIRVEPDGRQNNLPVFACNNDGSSCQAVPIPLSTANGRPIYLSLFGTGFTGADVKVTATANDIEIPVTYAGPQGGTPGLDQINLGLPPEILNSDVTEVLAGAHLMVSFAGIAANTVWIAVE